MKKTYFNWSTGKDAALALYHLQKNTGLSIDLLVTTVNNHHERVSMHGLRKSVLDRQVQSLGIPHKVISLPQNPSMETYDLIMKNAIKKLQTLGYTDTGFGDIYLEDLRNYREQQLTGIQCHFPLWKKDTKELLLEFIDLGFKAVVVCLNNELLDESFVGREIDHSFLNDLPENVDPCGENGEFHTFCYDGPIFKNPVNFELGEKVKRFYDTPNANEPHKKTGYWFIDLL